MSNMLVYSLVHYVSHGRTIVLLFVVGGVDDVVRKKNGVQRID